MLHTEALSFLLDGDPDRADGMFARAVAAAAESGAPPLAAVILADRALEIIRGGEFDAYWTSAPVYAWAARVALNRGDLTWPATT